PESAGCWCRARCCGRSAPRAASSPAAAARPSALLGEGELEHLVLAAGDLHQAALLEVALAELDLVPPLVELHRVEGRGARRLTVDGRRGALVPLELERAAGDDDLLYPVVALLQVEGDGLGDVEPRIEELDLRRAARGREADGERGAPQHLVAQPHPELGRAL